MKINAWLKNWKPHWSRQRRRVMHGLTLTRWRDVASEISIAGIEQLETRVLPAYQTGVNLIVNPGAESNLSSGWTVDDLRRDGSPIPKPETPQYDSVSGEDTGLPDSLSGGGNRFFWGGVGPQKDTQISQIIDISGGASSIDRGTVFANLSAFLGGYKTQNDAAKVSVVWRNASGGTIREDKLATVLAADRANTTKLILRESSTLNVPIGTRSARVIVFLTM